MRRPVAATHPKASNKQSCCQNTSAHSCCTRVARDKQQRNSRRTAGVGGVGQAFGHDGAIMRFGEALRVGRHRSTAPAGRAQVCSRASSQWGMLRNESTAAPPGMPRNAVTVTLHAHSRVAVACKQPEGPHSDASGRTDGNGRRDVGIVAEIRRPGHAAQRRAAVRAEWAE